MARHSNVEIHPERNPALKLLGRLVPLTTAYHGDRLMVRSPAATAATAVAHALARRFGAHVRTLVATGGKPVDHDKLSSVKNVERDERKPVDCLVAASNEADLLILGSRGLHGFAALGSVSERVSHNASCPVLVVR